MIDHSASYIIPHNSPTVRVPEDDLITAYDQIADDNSLLGIRKIRAMHLLMERVLSNGVQGAVAEFGVYKGGTGRFIARTFASRRCYLFDTFEGLPEPTGADAVNGKHLLNTGDFREGSLEYVEEVAGHLQNVTLRPGLFPSSTEGLEKTKFAFVHLDSDLFESITEGLKFFYPRMAKGGIIVIDDVDWEACPGVRPAAEKFLKGKKEHMEMAFEYQGYIVKQ